MQSSNRDRQTFQNLFYGPNLGYVFELYEKYVDDPYSVDEEIRNYFQQTGVPDNTQNLTKNSYHKVSSAVILASKIRDYGHLGADIYPLKHKVLETSYLEPSRYGLTLEDLKGIPVDIFLPNRPENIENGYEAFQYLKRVYTGKIAYEFHHVCNIEEKKWLQQKVEQSSRFSKITKEKQTHLLKRLVEVEEFEKFLHRTFVGQKRFSIEGLDSLVPLLNEIITQSAKVGTGTINIGMAHRGRLNVLAHILGKPYELIFSEFQHAPNKNLVPSEGSFGINSGWTGDVKYHLGLDRKIEKDNIQKVRINLANNPSHLEFVGAVVEGYTRAAQDDRTHPGFPVENPQAALSIIIHGDAAFPGQGIVAETLNLENLNGYRTNGSIHIIANNTIGFTTEPEDSRSTRYASDLAKGFEIPIVHVNADDPESCLKVARLACEYRETFHKDFLIDLIGYRRFGHNEMDEPRTSNPLLYNRIQQHKSVIELYAETLIEKGVITNEKKYQLLDSVKEKIQNAYKRVPEKNEDVAILNPPEKIEEGFKEIKTSVPLEILEGINHELLSWPDHFTVFQKLNNILQRRRNGLEKGGVVDWGHAETLAFASVLADGIPIRITGQDTERGTFAQRNLILHDHQTGETFSPLHRLTSAKASFSIYNSPLSEGAVLGFEYGYNVFAPETLVIWEAQYGDFANSAQVIIDQFIAAGRAKWGQKSSLVMLLPHGHEGQGPEHSSGRLERFLMLAAENNWTIANLTSAAQYFHILRRQAAYLKRVEVRPLIIMAPKSLLRHPMVASSGIELSKGEFKTIVEPSDIRNENVEKIERIIFCTGKIAIELAERLRGEKNCEWLHIIRVEQIYPFPEIKVEKIIKRFVNLQEIFWVQEEPKNMGAWDFVEPFLRRLSPKNVLISYVGRRRRSSPAEGDPFVHKKDQARILTAALTKGGISIGRNQST